MIFTHNMQHDQLSKSCSLVLVQVSLQIQFLIFFTSSLILKSSLLLLSLFVVSLLSIQQNRQAFFFFFTNDNRVSVIHKASSTLSCEVNFLASKTPRTYGNSMQTMNPKIFSAMAMAMSIHGTLCVLVLVLAYMCGLWRRSQ